MSLVVGFRVIPVRAVLALTFALIIALFAVSANAAPIDPVRCHAGAYRLAGGVVVDVAAVSDAAALRWRLLDGRTGSLQRAVDGAWRSTAGWTGRPDAVAVAFGECDEGKITFDGATGRRLTFDISETTFRSGDLTLRGRLVMPHGRGRGRVSVIVEVHGSENYSAVDLNHVQNLFPAHGIGVFVYDKRGTGGSQGTYTQDFHLLAGDAKAALNEARRLAGKRVKRIGFHGGSQAGWIAPLAATITPDAQFVVVGYGLAEGPLAEDREQVMLDLRRAGFGDDVLAQAREVTDATALVVASRGARGWEELAAVREKYGKTPWWGAMKGEFTGPVTQFTREQLEAVAAQMEQGTTWDHEPMPVLRAVKVPQLWILAGDDSEAPSLETQSRLRTLMGEGVPMTAAVFPKTDHGIREFETKPDGERIETRIAEGYFAMQIDWIRDGKLHKRGKYGAAVILTAARD